MPRHPPAQALDSGRARRRCFLAACNAGVLDRLGDAPDRHRKPEAPRCRGASTSLGLLPGWDLERRAGRSRDRARKRHNAARSFRPSFLRSVATGCVHPKPPSEYDWSVTDRAYQAMRGAEPERKPVMVIHDAPDWARDPTATCPVAACIPTGPRPLRRLAAFVQDAVTRYPNVRAIEVWNEPNTGPVLGAPARPGDYVELLALAHDAVTAAGAPRRSSPAGCRRSQARTRPASRRVSSYARSTTRGARATSRGSAPMPSPARSHWSMRCGARSIACSRCATTTTTPERPCGTRRPASRATPPKASAPTARGRAGPALPLDRGSRDRVVHHLPLPRRSRRDPVLEPHRRARSGLSPKPAYCELGAAIGDACPDTPDTEAPQTTIDSGPAGRTTNASPSFTFSSSEPNSSFECRLDSGSGAPAPRQIATRTSRPAPTSSRFAPRHRPATSTQPPLRVPSR